MSHNYPYRRPASDRDHRPEAGHYSSADRHRSSSDHDFYRPPAESYPSSSSSRASTSAQRTQDGALSILSSCGLEPSDLALLAKLPEDVLTVESLPSVLKQIKGKRGTINSFCPSTLSPSSSSSSYPRPPVSSSGDWDRPRSQAVQYPLHHVTPSSLPSDLWRNPRTSSSVWSDPLSASSSSSTYVDLHHRSGPSELGKTGRNPGPVSSQVHHSFSSVGQRARSRPTGHPEPRSADYRSAPRPELYHLKPRVGHRETQTSSTRKRTWNAAATLMPSEKEALDFHGTCPTVFPYSCSLCDITVLSERVWIKHINGTQHAEGQLSLMQKFPEWDCRVESVSRAKKQQENGEDEEKTTPLQTPSHPHKSKPRTKSDRKIPENSKVVCVKFPPQSVDETYLRKLTEPFGTIVKILMFPSLAFVELGSAEQVNDLVKFHVNDPPTVNGKQIEFSISNTFSFLRSSQVVSFTPVPSGEDGQSDLISIVRRFGPPLFSLFLPSMAYVEMKNAADAQKLVDYYSSNKLRVNNYCIKVSFSGEYKTLRQVPSAQTYQEKTVSTKRERSSSHEREDKTESGRRRSSTEHDRRKSSRERRSRSSEESVEGQKPAPECKEEPETLPPEDKADLSADDSDIEGMEVIGEDGENVEMQSSAEEEEAARSDSPEHEKDENCCEIKKPETCLTETEESAETRLLDNEVEPDFPVDLENCITLDELEENQSDTQDEAEVRAASRSCDCPSTRVVSLQDLPLSSYTDAEFIKLVQDFGTAVRYLLIRENQEGFIEMSSSSEAQRAAEHLSCKPVSFNGSRVIVSVSQQYHSLSNGCEVQSDPDHENKSKGQSSSSSSRTEKTSAERVSEMESNTKYEEKESPDRRSIKKASEEELEAVRTDESPGNELSRENEKASDLEKRKIQTENKDKKSAEKSPETAREGKPSEEPAKSQTESTGSSPKPQTEQLQDCEEPAGGTADSEKPVKPVGIEFVRPVVGYFCNLCQLIYADEDEAKLQHCSSPMHYRKYQEKTGKDPWSS